ncbi:ribosome silencing factor [Caldimonas brevitalea]|uniref:Ribosomal silencing factor RsfS n=1 Tax=Caldimonas brevitalea TaxID=413882 RepID=A0A0G3BNX6_9BURK|nr:ribosome silencing factor [Caldimonas brevitalea]AKJ28250.1 ribosome-associated protein [Caldimonas brevitalea]
MDIRKLQRAIVDGLEDVKAHDIQVFNTEHLSPLFERVIIASGTSNRQTKALAASVRDSVKDQGFQVMRTEGEDNGEWIIVDCGAAVAHIMQPTIRQYYHLEEIWGEKPVKLKLGAETKRLPKAEGADEDDDDDVNASEARPAAKKAPAKKAAAKKTASKAAAAKTPAAKKAASSRAAAPAAKKATAARKTPAAKKAPAKTRTVTVISGSVRAPAKKVAAKKAAASPAAAKKAGTRKA